MLCQHANVSLLALKERVNKEGIIVGKMMNNKREGDEKESDMGVDVWADK